MTQSLCRLDDFKDNCGFGLIAQVKGKTSHKLLQNAIQALTCMTHRGGVAADGKTGDGCGLLMQKPDSFLRAVVKETLQLELPESYAVGAIMLSTDNTERETAKTILTEELEGQGLVVLGWREVPTDNSCLGPIALESLPAFEQVFIAPGEFADEQRFSARLYMGRLKAEKRLEADSSFHVGSLGTNILSYKGLMMPVDLPGFYLDLADQRLETAICVFHQRFSTNTFPTWDLAQPFRYMCHNGEINTFRGNLSRMEAREELLENDLFGPEIKKILPIILSGKSDSASMDMVVEILLATGRSLPEVMMMLVPEAWEKHASMDEGKKAFYQYNACIMEPWDGPASIPFTDGKYIGALLDRNGLRPSRYSVTKDGYVVMSS